MASAFDEFIADAWNGHADDPAGVAARLAAALDAILLPAHIPPYARIVTHVYGEHLARYAEGTELLERLRTLPAWDDAPAARAAVARGTAVLRYCGGDATALDALDRDERIAALSTASSAFGEQKDFARAIAAFDAALALARPGIADDSPAVRALAVGGNNLAVVLEAKAQRDAQQTRSMLAAAQAGLEYWRRAGTWREEERAQFRLSASRRAAGDYDGAIRHAERCLAICRVNDAPALEHFFGAAALALAQRSAGLADEFEQSRRLVRLWHAQVAADERAGCGATLAALEDEGMDSPADAP